MTDTRDERDQELRRNAGADVGRAPGKVEGGEERPRPYPTEPGKTPGKAEGEEENFDERRRSVMGDEYEDPGTIRSPEPYRPD